MTLAAGTKLGRYEIRSQLGAGGMGEVYRARDEKLNRDVAIKVLPASLSQDQDRLRRFEQEAQAAATPDGSPTHRMNQAAIKCTSRASRRPVASGRFPARAEVSRASGATVKNCSI